jgi:hypothetical protein
MIGGGGGGGGWYGGGGGTGGLLYRGAAAGGGGGGSSYGPAGTLFDRGTSLPESVTISYATVDATPPTIAITSPIDGGAFPQNALIAAQFTCSDEPLGSGLATCTATTAAGAPLDTGTVGGHTLTVTARDGAGNTATQTVQYSVWAIPSVQAPPATDVQPSGGGAAPPSSPTPTVPVRAPTASLSVVIRHGNDPLAVGHTRNVAVKVVNHGPALAQGVRTTLKVGDGLTLGNGRRTERTVQFKTVPIAAGSSRTFQVSVRATGTATGPVTLAAGVASDTDDPQDADDHDRSTIAVRDTR